MRRRADLAGAAAFHFALLFALHANATVGETPPERVDRLLASLARYSGPPARVLATGKVLSPAPAASYPASWVCGVYVRDLPPPFATLFAELPDLCRSPAAYRPTLLARSTEEDPAIATWALVALAAMGPLDAEAIEALRERTTAADKHVRRAACAILIHEGDASGAAERSLSRDIRRVGVDDLTHQILSERGELDDEIIAAIHDALGRKPPIESAAYTLRVIREHPRGFEDAVPPIEDLVPAFAPDALRALEALGKPAAPALARVLATTRNLNHRKYALDSIAALGESASIAFDAVAAIATARSESEPLRRQAVHCLARIGANDLSKLIPEFRSLLADKPLRYAAAVEILRCSKTPKDHLEALDIVESAGWTTPAVLAISQLGRDGRHLASRLRRAWHEGRFDNVYDRLFVLRALCDIGATDAETIAILRAALDDASPGLQKTALECLRDIGPGAVSALPKILELCRNDSPDRADAVSAALSIDPASRIAWMILQGNLRSEDANQRGEALHALRRLFSTSPNARELVEGRLDDADASLRVLACEIIFENRGVDDRLMATLTKALGEPTMLVRSVAPLLEKMGAMAAPCLPLLRAAIYGKNKGDASAARHARDRILRAMKVDQKRASPTGSNRSSIPYVATRNDAVRDMLWIADVGKSDVVYDLGSGDGRVVIGAARDFGALRAIGVEIDPDRVEEGRANARKAGVADRVEFVQGDLFTNDLRQATVVTLFLGHQPNLQLRPRLLRLLHPGTRVVSHQFGMGEWRTDKSMTVRTVYFGMWGEHWNPFRDNPRVPDYTGNEMHYGSSDNILMWIVPAPVAGVWRGKVETSTGPQELILLLQQRLSDVSGTFRLSGQTNPSGTVRADLWGDHLRFAYAPSTRQGLSFDGRVKESTMRGRLVFADGGEIRETEWEARREPAELTGTWEWPCLAGPRAVALRVESAGGAYSATYIDRDQSTPIKDFYDHGGGFYFTLLIGLQENGTLVHTEDTGWLLGDGVLDDGALKGTIEFHPFGELGSRAGREASPVTRDWAPDRRERSIPPNERGSE